MSPLSSYVDMQIARNTVGIKRAGFGLSLFLSYYASFPERIRLYDDLAGVAVDFPTITGPEYLFAQAAFSQNPAPEQVAIGRGTLKPTAVYTMSLVQAPTANDVFAITVKGKGVTETAISITALADVTVSGVTNASDLFTSVAHGMATGAGPYRLTNSGGGLPTGVAVDTNYWVIRLSADTFSLATTYANAITLTAVNITTDGTGTHTVQRDANDVIVALLVDRLNSVVGKNFTAAQVTGSGDTDTWTVTATAAGDWFSLEIDPTWIVSNQTHADPGVATDLAAIALVNSDWYWLSTGYNSKLYAVAAAAWVEANSRVYLVNSSQSLDVTATVGGGGNSTMDAIKTLAYNRTGVWYHPSPANFLDAALIGRVAALDPGKYTLAFKTLSGVSTVTMTSTQRGNIVAKSGNSYELVAGVGCTFDGHTGDGEFMDTRVGLDWLSDDMSKGVFGVKMANDKIPMTDPGVAQIESEMRASLKRAVRQGILAADPTPQVTVPLVADISDANVSARILPDMKFSGRISGAVQKSQLRGSLTGA